MMHSYLSQQGCAMGYSCVPVSRPTQKVVDRLTVYSDPDQVIPFLWPFSQVDLG